MQLTSFTDYGFRILIYLGNKQDWATIEEISSHYKISKHHLVKVAHQLAKSQFIDSAKGRNGGISLNPKSLNLTLAEIVQSLEPNTDLVECFNAIHNTCPAAGACRLEAYLHEARNAFFKSLNQHTLANLLKKKPKVQSAEG